MFRRFSINFTLLSIALDALLVGVMLFAASHLRPWLDFLPFAADYPQWVPLPWQIYLLFILEWIAILAQFSVYDGRRNLRQVDELTNLTFGSILAAMAMAGTLYLSFREVSRLLFVTFILLTYLSMLLWRIFAQLVIRHRFGHLASSRRVLILGAGEAGREMQKQINAHPQTGLHLIGFLDEGLHPDDLEILGTFDSLEQVLRSYNPSDVVLALPQQAYEQINRMIEILHRQPVKVWLIPDYFRLALHKAAVEEFAGIPLLDLRAPALSDEQRLIKRAFDLVLSFIAMPFALVLMAIIGLAIRLEGPGGVIFSQTRMGENGKLFKMYKFRTMQMGAEQLQAEVERMDEQGRLIHKRADDPRVTRVGKFLRRSSLDELPQLFNVIMGDMSLVGPRPELPHLVECYDTWQRQRFAAPQGITGWWQINGRSDRPMHLHTEDDLYYIQHYSLALDVWILLRTFSAVIRGKGAF